MKKLMKKQKGITLIALVVTIIVLLILAGISIMMLTGQSGILNQARAAKEDTRGGEVKDEVALAVSENTMADYTGNGTRKSRQEVIDQLHKEGKLTDDEVTWLEEHDQITIGSIEIDFSSLGETSETLDNMYYLEGDYNDENGKIENIRLYFLPGIGQKIMEKYPDKFMTEEELVLQYALENEETTAKTFDEFMEEVRLSMKRIDKKYTTAKEFCMSDYIGWVSSEEEFYSYIQYLREQYDSEGKMTEDELVLRDALENEETTAKTFEQWMEELYNPKKYKTAKEFCMSNYIGWVSSEEEFYSYIQYLREEYEGNKMTIEDSMGNQMNNYWYEYRIEEQGKHEFKIKIGGEEVDKITINIDQYEIVFADGNINNENYDDDWITGVVAYDFTNGKILIIDGGEYNYTRGNGEEGSKTLTSEEIETIEGVGSFIREFPYSDTIYKYKIKSGITIEGYFYRQPIPI